MSKTDEDYKNCLMKGENWGSDQCKPLPTKENGSLIQVRWPAAPEIGGRNRAEYANYDSIFGLSD